MYRLGRYSEASLLRTLYMDRPFRIPVVCVGSLSSSILNFWSVVRVVSGKINFTVLLCREYNLFLRTSLHPSHTTDV